jgi:hypothetical protein
MISFFKFIEIGIQDCFNKDRYRKSNISCCWSFYKKRKKIRIKIYEPPFIFSNRILVSKHGLEYTGNLLRTITFLTTGTYV